MLSCQTQQLLCETNKIVANCEMLVETCRNHLAQQPLFEVETAFNRINSKRDGSITINELKEFLQENTIMFTDRQLCGVFQYIDFNMDGKICIEDFKEQILPQKDLKLKQELLTRKAYFLEPHQQLPLNVEKSLSCLFEQEILNYDDISNAKSNLYVQNDFNACDGFLVIDYLKSGYITLNNLDDFQKRNNIYISQDGIEGFLRRLGKATGENINMQEFQVFYNTPQIKQNKHQTFQQQICQPLPICQPQPLCQPPQVQVFPQITQEMKKQMEMKHQENIVNNSKLSLTQSIVQNSAQTRANPSPPGITDINNKNRDSQYIRYIKTTNLSSSLKKQRSQKKMKQSPESKPNIQISPEKPNEINFVIENLKQQILADRELEKIKNVLACQKDFNLFDGFRIIDSEGQGFLKKKDLITALNKIGIYPSTEQINLLFTKYDKNKEGVFRYSQFCKIIVPIDEKFAKMLEIRQPQYTENVNLQFFDTETQKLFKQLFTKQLETEYQAEVIRQKLQRKPNFSLNEAFALLDQNSKGFISQNDFRSILSCYGLFVNNIDVSAFLNRYDRTGNGVISFGEFEKEMSPRSPRKLY